MAQIITPPAAGIQEVEGKNWHRAQALRRIALDLSQIHEQTPKEDTEVRKLLWDAAEKLAKVQNILAPPPKVAKQQRMPKY